MKKYNVIYADPPWSYKSKKSGGFNMQSGAASKYSTMTVEEISDLPIPAITQKDAVIFLWATNPLLPDAFEVMKAWGFKYKTTITWRKIMSMGMGYWWRGQCEFLLFGVKGNVKAFRRQEANIIQCKVGRHSEKPHEFRQLIEKSTPHLEDKLEMFARSRWPGWDVFGDQVNNSIELKTIA